MQCKCMNSARADHQTNFPWPNDFQPYTGHMPDQARHCPVPYYLGMQ